jgi:uncharacterized Zn-binding protein involved in type VI secretion
MSARFGVPLWAAKKGDMCLHKGKVVSGSPDTTIEGKPAARFTDLHECKVHPPIPPGKGWERGIIVTASSSVFINHLGAARKTDLCQCLVPSVEPPGAASPVTSAYSVKPSDSYEKMMAVEHELADWDKVKDVKEPGKVALGEADDPLGVAEAALPPRPKKRASDDSFALQGKPGDNRALAGPRASGSATPAASVANPSLAGGGPAGTPPEQTAREKNDKRKGKPPKLTLELTLDLSVGSRAAIPHAGVPMDVIEPRNSTVYVGGAAPPPPPPPPKPEGE